MAQFLIYRGISLAGKEVRKQSFFIGFLKTESKRSSLVAFVEHSDSKACHSFSGIW